MTLGTTTPCIMPSHYNATKNNDNQHYYTYHNYAKHKDSKLCVMLSVAFSLLR